jgi:hypothetical protein
MVGVANNQRQQQPGQQFAINGNSGSSYPTSQQQIASLNTTASSGHGARTGQYYPPNNYYTSQTVKSNETMII